MERAGDILAKMLRSGTYGTLSAPCLWHNLLMNQSDKASAGRKGGMKKVPKGFAKANGEDKAANSRHGTLSRWGKEKSLVLTIKYLPSEEEKIIDYVRKLIPEKGIRDQGTDLEDAFLGLACFNPLLAELRLDVTASIQNPDGTTHAAAVQRGDEPEVEAEQEKDPFDFPLARKLAAAYISEQMGISVSVVEKRHLTENPEELGALWYRLAEIARQLMTASHK